MLFVAVLSVGVLIAGRVFGGPLHAVGFALLNLVLWMVLTEILIIPHEAAHVGIARTLGLRVFEVAIGSGPLIASWRVFGFGVKVHALPFVGGLTTVGFASRRLLRTKWMLMTAAGPGVHVLMLAPWLVGSWPIGLGALFTGPALGPVFLLANVWLFILSALPQKSPQDSDGLVLLKAPFRSEAELNRLVEGYPLLESVAAREEGRLEAALVWLESVPPESAGTAEHLLHRGMVLVLMGRIAAARDAFQEALGTGGDASPLEPTLWNNTAWADTMLGELNLLEEADTLSRRALEAAPWSRPLKGTRGAVLVWKAAHQEAIPLLREALEDPRELHPMAHASYRAALCLALMAVGERDAAATELARGEAACPSCVLLSRARASVAAES
jgi:hypothetical protein